MIRSITIDSQLANDVEREIYSIRTQWLYFPNTNEFYQRKATDHQREVIDRHSKVYGPMDDTQRFTYIIHQLGYGQPVLFSNIRNNPNSYYRRNFVHLAKLIDLVQTKHIPSNYIVERLFINMQTIRPSWSMNDIHPDVVPEEVPDAITILYYVNDSDGDTFFFDDEKCIHRSSPIKGTAVIYPSATLHAGSTPVATQTRTVINMVFIPRPANI